jgi:hypothetical protein
MRTSGLIGPFRLAVDVIAAEVAQHTPGAFALGDTDGHDRFCVAYVGSCASDLRQRLLDYVGTARFFKFRAYESGETAFAKECELFHAFMPIGNVLHPERRAGSDWRCPRCWPGDPRP